MSDLRWYRKPPDLRGAIVGALFAFMAFGWVILKIVMGW